MIHSTFMQSPQHLVRQLHRPKIMTLYRESDGGSASPPDLFSNRSGREPDPPTRRISPTIGAGLFVVLAALLQTTHAGGEFQRGNAAYESGKFDEAVGEYEASIRSGMSPVNLFYNLGNAYERSGQPGRAILNYRRTLELMPRHPEARANLAFVRTRTGAEDVTTHPVTVRLRLISSQVLLFCASAGFWIAAALGVGALAGPRRHRVPAMIGAALAMLFCGGFVAAWWWRPDPADLAVVVSPKTVVRFAPAESSKAVGEIPEGSEVRILDAGGPWTYVEIPGGARGWIDRSALESLLPPNSANASADKFATP